MRNFGSILLLIILVPVTVVIFLVLSLQTNLLTSHFLKHELATRNTYAIVEDQLSQQIAKIDIKDLPVNNADIQTFANRVLPASWLQQNVESTLDQFFTWFNGPAGEILSISIDLTGPKAEFTPALENLIQAAIPRLDACPKHPQPTDLCRVPNMTVAQVEEILKQNKIDVANIISQIPDTFDLANPVVPSIKLSRANLLTSPIEVTWGNMPQVAGVTITSDEQKKIDEQKKLDAQKNQDQGKIDEQKKLDDKNSQKSSEPKKTFQEQVKDTVASLTKAKIQYHQILQYWLYALIIYCLIILGYIGINIKGWKRLTRWVGILLLTLGTLPLAISIASKIVLEQKVIPIIHFSSNIPADIQTAILGVIRDVQAAVFSPILWVSAAMFILGLAGIIGAHFISRQKKTKQAKPA